MAVIDQPLARHPVDRKRMSVQQDGRRAVTHFTVLERFRSHTLVRVRLETGRTHQIRVHFAWRRNPLVGDPVYGKGRSLGINLTGQALHAWRLELQHPVTGKLIEAIAPLPPEFLTLLEVLRKRASS